MKSMQRNTDHSRFVFRPEDRYAYFVSHSTDNTVLHHVETFLPQLPWDGPTRSEAGLS